MLTKDQYFKVQAKKYHAIFCKEIDHPAIVETLKKFRKQLFVDHCGWDLTVENDLEQDQFDRDDTIHCGLYHNNKLVGTFRAIRTDQPYLTQTLFTDLYQSKSLPEAATYWEISRFGVLPEARPLQHSLFNYSVMFHFAKTVNAEKLISIADLSYERFLYRTGIKTKRYGSPQKIGKDKTGRPITAVAGEISLQEQQGEKFQNILKAIQQVSVINAL